MRFFELFEKEIVSLAFSSLLAFIGWIAKARTKLVWGRTHNFSFILRPDPPAVQEGEAPLPAPPAYTANTASFFIHNAGRSAATKLEITFNFRPNNYQVWPVRPYEIVMSPDERFTLRFENLAPKEQFQIEILNAYNMPELLNVRCAEGVGKLINMRPMQVISKWLIVSLWVLIFLGVAAIFYILMRLGSLLQMSGP